MSDLLWVANTAHGPAGHWHARVRAPEPDHDHLSTAGRARSYLADHGVPVPVEPPDDRSLSELAVLRRVVERVAAREAEPWTAEARGLLEDARFALTAEGRIASELAGWSGFCRDLLVPLVALIAGQAPLGRCSNPRCRLLFQDRSRNHGRRWCDSGGCGNRDRVRRARGRADARNGTGPGEQGGSAEGPEWTG